MECLRKLHIHQFPDAGVLKNICFSVLKTIADQLPKENYDMLNVYVTLVDQVQDEAVLLNHIIFLSEFAVIIDCASQTPELKQLQFLGSVISEKRNKEAFQILSNSRSDSEFRDNYKEV